MKTRMKEGPKVHLLLYSLDDLKGLYTRMVCLSMRCL